jgi:hypothetical protein
MIISRYCFEVEVVDYDEKKIKPGRWKEFWLTCDREDDMRMEESKEKVNQSRYE